MTTALKPETKRPLFIPTEAFKATPELVKIEQSALIDHFVSPTGLYAALLANAASHIRPGVLTPLGAEPNMHIGLCGRDGNGKGLTFGAADEILHPPHHTTNTYGDWECFADSVRKQQREGHPVPGIAWRLHHFRPFEPLFTGGKTSRDNYRHLFNSETVDHRKYGVEGGTYRVTVRIAVYRPIETGWLFLPRAVEQGLTTMFLYAKPDAADPESQELRTLRKELRPLFPNFALPVPDWSAVSDGPLACPPSARGELERYHNGGTSAFDRNMIRLRFTVATAHAALHNRTQISDEDWAWTQYPLQASVNIAAMNADQAPKFWSWNGMKPVRKAAS